MTRQNERNYFYRTIPNTPTPPQMEKTLEHLTGRIPSQVEMAKLDERLSYAQNDYAPGGDVHQRVRRVIQ